MQPAGESGNIAARNYVLYSVFEWQPMSGVNEPTPALCLRWFGILSADWPEDYVMIDDLPRRGQRCASGFIAAVLVGCVIAVSWSQGDPIDPLAGRAAQPAQSPASPKDPGTRPVALARVKWSTPTTQPVNATGPVPIPLSPTTFPADTPDPFSTPGDDFRVDLHDVAMLSAAADSLDRFPPSVVVPPERRDALMLLDSVFHDPYARERKAVQAFHVERARRIVEQLEKTKVTEGAKIWAFYNMGFVIRTKSATLGFDLTAARHLPGFTLPDELMKRLLAQCDVLFISHTHWDHADPVFAQNFIDAGKPVVGPPDLWAGYPINAKLTPLGRAAGKPQALQLKDGATLTVTVNPGFQHMKDGPDVTNNVYVVRTPDELCFAHTGDNNGYLPSGFEWIDEVHTHGKVDVLLFNDWTQMVPRTLRGFDPNLVIAGHYDELGHENVWARAPYWRGLLHAEKSKVPWLVMAWGESYDYKPADFPAAATTRPAANSR